MDQQTRAGFPWYQEGYLGGAETYLIYDTTLAQAKRSSSKILPDMKSLKEIGKKMNVLRNYIIL